MGDEMPNSRLMMRKKTVCKLIAVNKQFLQIRENVAPMKSTHPKAGEN
jgi:hypothetical protein